MNLKIKNILPVFLLLLISLVGVFSFFHAGFFPSHDGEWMVIRFSDFHRSLADGQFPVRWAGRLNFTYGYPVFDFLYPGTFYFTEIFHLLKLNFVNSVKASFVVSYIFSGVFMFLLGRKMFGGWGGLIAGILYLFAPYRFIDLYVRGSLGESVAFMFPPLIGYFWLKAQEGKNNCWLLLTPLVIAGLILSHNVIAYLFLPVLLGFILLSLRDGKKRREQIFRIIFTFGSGVLLAAFFWLPALWDRQFTVFDQVVIANYRDNFPNFWELIMPRWSFGPSEPGNPDSMSFQVGIVNLIIIILSLIYFLRRRVKTAHDEKGIYFLAVFFLALFFLTPYSAGFWDIIGLSIIQFPWRILSVLIFCSSILGGFLFTVIPRSLQKPGVLLVLGLILVLNFSYTKPNGFVQREEGYYFTNEDTTTVQNEYLPGWAKNLKREKRSRAEVMTGSGEIKSLITKSNLTSFAFSGKGVVRINTVYFPGWQIKVNGKEHPFQIDDEGLIRLNLDQNAKQVKIVFGETPLRLLADLVSLTTLVVLVIFLVKSKYEMG